MAGHGNGGEGSHASGDVLLRLRTDPIFTPFIKDDFDPTTFASQALASGSSSASEEVQRLNAGIGILENELRNEVISKHDSLLQQVGGLQDTEGTLSMIKGGVEALQAAMQRVRLEVSEPYQQIKTRTVQLKNLNETIDLLRRVIHMLKLIQKLKQHMSSQADLAKAAKLLHDLRQVQSEGDAAGIAVIDRERAWIDNAGREIHAQAQAALINGMMSLSQAEVGSALQVYYNLGDLKKAVTDLMHKYVVQVGQHVQAALDPKAISVASGQDAAGGGRAGPAPGNTARWQDALWQQLAACLDQVHGVVVAVWHLQRVLSKKRDPISHSLFLDELIGPGEPLLTESFWDRIIVILGDKFKAAMVGSAPIKDAFVAHYPRLVSQLDGMVERLLRDTEVKGVPPAVQREQLPELLKAVEPFQSAYLARSLARLSELVNGMFPAGLGTRSAPTHQDVQKLLGRLHEECRGAGSSQAVAVLATGGVAKVLQLFCERCEITAATGPDVSQVAGGPATLEQQKNVLLVSHLQEVHGSIAGLCQQLPPAAKEKLRPALANMQAVAVDVMAPMFRGMLEEVEGRVLAVHKEGYKGAADGDETDSSRYMMDLCNLLAHFRREFLSKFTPAASAAAPTFASGMVEKMAARLLVFFVRHAALVRPVSDEGRLRLARDMAELEMAVSQHLYAVEQLGAPHRALRALRPLLFLDLEEVPTSPLLKDLPAYIVAFHLYSRGPELLVSPYARAGLSAAQYSLWLDQHEMPEILKGVRGSLDAYAALVAQRGDKEFHAVYPIMTKIVEDAEGALGIAS